MEVADKSSSQPALYPQRLPKHDIRLLTVLPSSDRKAPIECELRQYAVGSAPAYEGLSYVWGDAKDVDVIVCNGFHVEVTKSLRCALGRIRKTERPQTIWADALCMNQKDVKEKNVHVPLMGRVFSQSTNTVVYLGEASNVEAIEAKAGLNALMKFMEDLTQREGLPTNDFHRLFTAVGELPKDLVPIVTWSAVEKLFNAAWFSRIWCTQEILLAPDMAHSSYAMYGHVRIVYQSVARVGSFLKAAAEWMVDFIPRLNLPKQISAIGFVDQFHEQLELVEILHWFRDHEATDPRDKVYGLLGILRQRFGYNIEGINVDYSATVAQVYTDTATEVLRTHQNLELLDFISHTHDDERGEEFPTWVPRWDKPHTAILPTYADSSVFEAALIAAGSEADKRSDCWAIQDDRLVVFGLLYDTVTRSVPLTDATIGDTVARYWRHLQTTGDRCFGSQERLSAAARTWTLGGVSAFFHFNEADDLQRQTFVADFLAYVHRFMPLCSISCPGAPEDGMYTIDASDKKHLGSAERYARIVKISCENLSVFETSLGDYGVSTNYIRPGDSIVGLLGGSSPFALRGKDKNHQVVGAVYIDNLMDGSTFRKMLDDGQKIQFTLV